MEQMIRQALLDAGYEETGLQLETTPSGRVGGFVISTRFDGMPQIDRQDMLWRELRDVLDPATLDSIVSLLTMTPDEIEDDVSAASG